jgi:hypothetical protein
VEVLERKVSSSEKSWMSIGSSRKVPKERTIDTKRSGSGGESW